MTSFILIVISLILLCRHRRILFDLKPTHSTHSTNLRGVFCNMSYSEKLLLYPVWYRTVSNWNASTTIDSIFYIDSYTSQNESVSILQIGTIINIYEPRKHQSFGLLSVPAVLFRQCFYFFNFFLPPPPKKNSRLSKLLYNLKLFKLNVMSNIDTL